MAFLDDFKDWKAFVLVYPGMNTVKEKYSDLIFFMGLKDWEKIKGYEPLKEKYGEADLTYGVATLLGVGKGENQKVLHLGSVILKYGNVVSNVEKVNTHEFQGTVIACVNKARELLRRVCERFQDQKDALLDEVLSHHFKVGRSSALWGTVQTNFTTLHNAMQGVIRISDNDPSRPSSLGAKGYVSWKNKTDYKDRMISPYKTAGINPRDQKEVYAGSIHIDYVLFMKVTTANIPKIWSDLAIAGLIVHEASHKFCFTVDHALVHNGTKYDDLTAELRAHTADSYSYAAMSIGNGKLIKSYEDTARYQAGM